MMELAGAFLWVVISLVPAIIMLFVGIRIAKGDRGNKVAPSHPKDRVEELREEIRRTGKISSSQYQEFVKLTGSTNPSEWGLN